MATEAQKTIERMTTGLSDHQCRAFAALIRDVRDGESDGVVMARVAQARALTCDVDDLGDLSERKPAEPEKTPSLRVQLDALKFDKLKEFATSSGVNIDGMIKRVDITDAIMKAATEAQAQS